MRMNAAHLRSFVELSGAETRISESSLYTLFVKRARMFIAAEGGSVVQP
jgi:hypothetical protein